MLNPDHAYPVVALGASNTAGYGVGQSAAYPAIVQRLLADRGRSVRVLNAGISGNTTAEMLARLPTVISTTTRVVLLQPGSNDSRLGISEAVRQGNIDSITTWLEARGIRVIRVASAFAAARPGNLQSDGVHYTEAGHDLIARLLVDRVAAALDA